MNQISHQLFSVAVQLLQNNGPGFCLPFGLEQESVLEVAPLDATDNTLQESAQRSEYNKRQYL